MRRLALLVLLSAGSLRAGPWALDVGLLAGIAPNRFAGEPAGLDPASFFFPPQVTASGGTGLLGQAGVDFSLSHKRRWQLSLQPQWQGRSLVLDERLDLLGTVIQRQTVWEWQSFALPLALSYAWPLARREAWALLLRAGGGAWYASVQARHKTLSSGTGSPLERPWPGPPDDWGGLASLGLDWLDLPSGRRRLSLELRADRGTAPQDPAAGAGLPAWSLGVELVIPVWSKVL